MGLTSDRVHEIYKECLYTTEEMPEDAKAEEDMPEGTIFTDGIMFKTGFHPGRIAEHKEEIFSMLLELPDAFMSTKGGGMSFLNMCMTKDDVHWAEHPTMDLLSQLGMATGKMKSLFPKSMKSVLPGGMPYFVVIDS